MKDDGPRNIKWLFFVFRQGAVIILISITLGFLVNQARKDRLSLIADWSSEARLSTESGESLIISLDEARALCINKKALFLDARSPELYGKGHIRCAQNIPWQSFEEYIDLVFEMIPDNAWIVAYCDGEYCSLSEDLAQELLSMGYERVRVLLNGWTRWLEAGFPVEHG